MKQKRNKRKPIRPARKTRRAFYKTVHAILPRKIRQPLRNAIKGPPPSPEEVAAERLAQAAEREAEAADRQTLKEAQERAKAARAAERQKQKEAQKRAKAAQAAERQKQKEAQERAKAAERQRQKEAQERAKAAQAAERQKQKEAHERAKAAQAAERQKQKEAQERAKAAQAAETDRGTGVKGEASVVKRATEREGQAMADAERQAQKEAEEKARAADRQAQRADREAKKEAAQREKQNREEGRAKNDAEVGSAGAMSRLPLSDRIAISAQRRLSRALVASGIRVRAWKRRGGEAGDVPALAATGRFLIESGTMVGERSRAHAKEAKRRANAARAAAETSDPELASLPRAPDLRPLVTEQHERETERVRAELADLAGGNDPVLVGPFLGEVGFELLYWVPFVRWALQEFPRLRGRLIVASRGGTRSWYGHGLGDYVDALDVFPAEEFVERREGLKQRERTSLDLELVSAVAARFGLHRYKHLHPAVMWHGYYQAIKADERSYARAVRGPADGTAQPLLGLRSRYAPIAPPPPGELERALPSEFVAARFYFRPSFPDTAANRAFAAGLLSAISQHIPVVSLNNGLKLDEHADLDLSSPRIVTIGDRMTPANNLHVQTVVLSRARTFVGTYGGLAYLAPHLGVPSLAFLEDGLAPWPWHLELAQQIFRGPPWGSLAVMTTRDLSVLELLAGSLAQPQSDAALSLTAP